MDGTKGKGSTTLTSKVVDGGGQPAAQREGCIGQHDWFGHNGSRQEGFGLLGMQWLASRTIHM